MVLDPSRFRAFATDFDGTLAHHDIVLPETLAALDRLRAAGFSLLMVTGRELLASLERRGVGPTSVGQCIVATWTPHEATVFEVIKELGLDLQIILYKGAAMILPTAINKASGLKAALEELT